jgi:putative SOS response-associated peptidase YedK
MCGRFSLKTTPDTLERIFGHAAPPGYRPRYNVAPGQQILAIVSGDGEERTAMLRWGLIPFWANDPSIGNRLINARAESIARKPAFRNALRRRRCVILADGFYEWQRRDDGRYPMWVRLATEEPFAMAGLWERWDRGKVPIESCTILTTEANPFMRTIHTRMPIIFDDEARSTWLSADAGDARLLNILDISQEFPLRAHEVSKLVNSPANDGPECIDRVDPSEKISLTLDLV